jgi:hypothetical protein
MYVAYFSKSFFLKHLSFSEELSQIWSKMYIVLHVKYPSFLSDFHETWIFSKQIFTKSSNIKFHENPSSGSRDVSCVRTDRNEEVNSHSILWTPLKMSLEFCIEISSKKIKVLWNATLCDMPEIRQRFVGMFGLFHRTNLNVSEWLQAVLPHTQAVRILQLLCHDNTKSCKLPKTLTQNMHISVTAAANFRASRRMK